MGPHQSTDEEKWAWVAGLIEGEGCLSVLVQKTGKQKGRFKVCVIVKSTDLDVLQRLYVWTGCGQPPKRVEWIDPKATKRDFRWRVSGQSDVRWLLERIRPWLCERRQRKADECLAALDVLAERRVKST
jgi:hypothetical protein